MSIQYKNAHIGEGFDRVIECEFEHPVHGWIPTSIDMDAVDEDQTELLEIILSENSEDDLKRVVRDGVLRKLTTDEQAQENAGRLESHRQAKDFELSTACENQITEGFVSSALGAPHTYPSDRDSQTNLIGASRSSAGTLFMCADENGVWERRHHTIGQLQLLIDDGIARKQTILAALDERRIELAATTTAEEIDAVTWVEV